MAEVMRHSSSFIEETVYDQQEEQLDITFANGRTFRYSAVPRGIYTAFITSGSKGRFFHSTIKDGYDTEEV